MAQIIVQSSAEELQGLYSSERPLHGSYELLKSVLRNRLGTAHANLLAEPAPLPDGGVRWQTPLPGPVQAASSLGDADATLLRGREAALVREIAALATLLESEGGSSTAVAGLLRQALQMPAGDWLYSVGGEPVRLMWGHGAAPATAAPSTKQPTGTGPASGRLSGGFPGAGAGPTEAASPDALAAATPFSAEPVAASASGAAPSGASQPSRARRLLPWLALLVLAAALLAVGMKRCSVEPDAALRLAEAQTRNEALEDELRKRQGEETKYLCVPDPVASAPEPAASEPEAPASAPEPVASAPEPAPSAPTRIASSPAPVASAPPRDPYETLRKRIADAKDCKAMQAVAKDSQLKDKGAQADGLRESLKTSMDASCKEDRIRQAVNQCPGERPPQLAPELAIVFDASGSMRYSLDATPQEIAMAGPVEKAAQIANVFRILKGQARVEPPVFREPRRITPAREAAEQLVGNVPSDVNVGLVIADSCPAARDLGVYPPERRGDLLNRIRAIQPYQGTPLADGVAKAGGILDGVNRQSVMVVISDGEESCGGDPCAQAARLAAAKPHLTINVVDITGAGAGNCLAQATGGKVYRANSAEEIAKMIRLAGADALGPEKCAKP